MHAEIMAIGDELTSGQRLDTNSQWLSERLGEVGIAVRFHTTVADELPDLVRAVQIATDRAPLVIITGGLGPTADDLTRQAIAEAANVSLDLHADILEHIRGLFERRGRTMPAQNEIQAMFPRGSRVIPNPHGSAPGIDLSLTTSHGTSRIFALPGVPAEMREMWEATVRPAVVALSPEPTVLCHHRIKCFGVGESHLEGMLPDLIRRGNDPRVGITVHRATITLRITASGPDEAACRARMEPTIRTIHECLGPLVYGEENDELEDVVIRRLTAHDATLSVCEWGTQGQVIRWLRKAATATPSMIPSGLVVASRETLTSWFGPLPSLDAEGSFKNLVAWMARSVRERVATDWGLAVGPAPDLGENDPQIYLALASAQDTHCVRYSYGGHPDIVLDRAAKQALDLICRRIDK